MVFKSIRWRMQIWYGLIFSILLSAFGVTVFQLEKTRRLRKVDQELQARVNAVLGIMRPRGPGGEFRGPRPEGPEGRPLPGPPEFRDGPPEFRESPPDGPGPMRERGPGGRGPMRGGRGFGGPGGPP